MSAVSKSLNFGTIAFAIALAGCGGDDGGGGGMGAAATGGGGGTAGTNPQAGAGAMGGTGGAAGMNMAAGNGGVGGVNPMGGSGAVSGGGAVGGGGDGGSAPPGMCSFEPVCATANDTRTGSTCADAASGVFAIKTVIDVWWQDDVTPPLVDPGRNFITVYLKGTLTDVCADGSDGCGEMMGCGTILPPFTSWANCNAYAITIPDAIWDQPTMPKFYTHGNVNMFEPGGLLTIAKATGLVGFNMENADDAAWPTSIDAVTCMGMTAGDPTSCFPDHDGDGRPGISIIMGKVGENFRDTGCFLTDLGGNGPVKYQGAPLDGLLGALCDPMTDTTCKRATDLSIGLRTRLGGGGLIDTCAAGTAQGKGASDADYLDSRVAGCKLNDGTECTIDNVKFVDSSAPFYNILDMGAAPPSTVMSSSCDCPGGCAGEACVLDQTPSAGSRSAVIRLGDAGQPFDCATVRNAVETAFPGNDI